MQGAEGREAEAGEPGGGEGESQGEGQVALGQCKDDHV